MRPAPASLRTDINITPLIDIVLVLLIVFIVMVPALGYAQRAQASGASAGGGAHLELPRVEVLGEGRYRMGGEEMAAPALSERLCAGLRVQAPADRKVVLVVPPEVPLSVASQAMDLVHGSAERVGRREDVRTVLVEAH